LFTGAPVLAAPDEKLREEQVEYSKGLYQEGVAAMSAKQYDTALTKFKEAYRYAPDLHLFTYNIGSAAEMAGDCNTARTYYGMFLDLVPEHPERKKVEKTYGVLQVECPYDAESEEMVTAEDRNDRAARRAREEADRVMADALTELRTSVSFYQAAGKRFPETKAFRRAAWRKKWNERRMVRLLSSYEIKPNAATAAAPEVPDTVVEACRKASAQEKRNADAFESVAELYDTRDVGRVMGRFLRGVENRDRPAFKACSR
jgi:tetratricopeptide (TPR) repeat protein